MKVARIMGNISCLWRRSFALDAASRFVLEEKVVLKRKDKMPTIAKLRIKIILLVMALAIAK